MTLFNSIASLFNDSVNLLLDRELRIGITGLSRGGKTALITSMINNVCQFSDPSSVTRLARFTPLRTGHLVYGGIAKNRDLAIPAFPYVEAMQALYSEPAQWPIQTDGISRITLELRVKDSRWYTTAAPRSIFVDLWDYPGEWLMDLMLLDLNYAEFSKSIRDRLAEFDKVVPATKWFTLGQKLDPNKPVNSLLLKGVIQQYTEWLKACRKHGFALLVPGRFILPGIYQGTQLLEFVPWVWGAPAHYKQESLYSTLEERYEAYKELVVHKFYKDCFSKLDRQIVLVDCLQALMGGRETFMDINDSFDVLLKHFNYGDTGLMSRLFAPKIDKVLFVATKADSVTHDQHANLLSLLQSMIQQACTRVRANGSHAEAMVLSSIRATQCNDFEQNGINTQILTTDYPEDGGYFPGSVPRIWTRENMEFFQQHFTLRALKPPRLAIGQAIPHLNLDLLFEYLFGDKIS